MKSKSILITGGTLGIGRQTALFLASQGHQVFAASRKPLEYQAALSNWLEKIT